MWYNLQSDSSERFLEDKAMTEMNGIVKKVIFRNEKTGYTIVACKVDGFKMEFSALGKMPEVKEGGVLYLKGKWEEHEDYGTQFKASSVEVE